MPGAIGASRLSPRPGRGYRFHSLQVEIIKGPLAADRPPNLHQILTSATRLGRVQNVATHKMFQVLEKTPEAYRLDPSLVTAKRDYPPQIAVQPPCPPASATDRQVTTSRPGRLGGCACREKEAGGQS